MLKYVITKTNKFEFSIDLENLSKDVWDFLRKKVIFRANNGLMFCISHKFLYVYNITGSISDTVSVKIPIAKGIKETEPLYEDGRRNVVYVNNKPSDEMVERIILGFNDLYSKAMKSDSIIYIT